MGHFRTQDTKQKVNLQSFYKTRLYNEMQSVVTSCHHSIRKIHIWINNHLLKWLLLSFFFSCAHKHNGKVIKIFLRDNCFHVWLPHIWNNRLIRAPNKTKLLISNSSSQAQCRLFHVFLKANGWKKIQEDIFKNCVWMLTKSCVKVAAAVSSEGLQSTVCVSN